MCCISAACSGRSLHLIISPYSSSDCPSHVRRTKSSIKKRIIVRRTVRSMFGKKQQHKLDNIDPRGAIIIEMGQHKLQALVYHILPSATAVFSYATGSRKLSANEQFFVGAQTVVSLLQTTQMISDVCFITDHVAYASSNKIKTV